MTEIARVAEFLTPEQVSAQREAKDWKEAVELVGELMVKADICQPEYVEAMKQTVLDFGPYIVIAPGVAMPHARPESGVIKPGIAVITLKTPCNFGNEANDPVDFVIAFAAVDKNEHIKTLQSIATLLQNEEAVKAVRAAQTDEALYQALS